MRDLVVLFSLVVALSSLLHFSAAQPFCGEFDGVLVFDGSDATATQFANLLQFVQGTARSFNWRGAEAARIGALEFSDVTYEVQDVLYYTEPEWALFGSTVQYTGTKNLTEALLSASDFVLTPTPPLRTQYIVLFVTNNGASAVGALPTSELLTNAGQRIVTVFLQDSQMMSSTDVSALASSPKLAFTIPPSDDPKFYYNVIYNISRAICTDLNELMSFEDECPSSFKISSGMCGCAIYDVNGCDLPQCSLPSTFEDATTGGWRIINSNGVLSTPLVETYAGGRNTFNTYITAEQLAAPTTSAPESVRYFLAPSAYLGPQSQLFGGFVLFSLELELKSARFSATARPRFIIEGDNAELILYHLPNEGQLRNNVWGQFSIPIINDGNLQVRNKTTQLVRIALQQDILDVLQFVRSIRVLVDYVDDYNGANLDNFKFCSYDRLDTFETGTDGYFVVDSEGKADPSWQLNFISFEDRTPDETDFNFYYVPSWATGVPCVGVDLSRLNGGFLGYDINMQNVNSSYKIADDIVISGKDKELVYRLLRQEYPTTNLTRVRVPISESSGRWYVTDRTVDFMPNKPYPRVPTPEDFTDVLSDVSFIFIRGEYLTQVDTSLLHTTFTVANAPQQCLGLPVCSGHGRCVAGGCSCYYGWTGPNCEEVALCAAGSFKLSDFAA